ncbi:MAG: OsmC family protein [Bacteroidia bacterium]|jgi:putative redox protein|nr:OsmC family protein [Bacteroidia bacterium]
MNVIKAKNASGSYVTTISNGIHQIIADEPEELNGTNTGPAPDELLLMSLASCTAITLRMYAERKNWPIADIEVQVDMNKADGLITFIRNIEIKGDIDDEQKTRLKAIANACPVHKILTSTITIETLIR